MKAVGHFEIELAPLDLALLEPQAGFGRLSIDKTFFGDLSGSSRGEMLSLRPATQGSAGYVALEFVTGALHGRRGSFALQHSSTMTRGEARQSITVVPDSGTDALTGLTGSMVIDIVDGQHHYTFDYHLEAS